MLPDKCLLPEEGFTHINVRTTESYIRELTVISGTKPLLISLVTSTTHFDGKPITTKVETNYETVGYFGYLDNDGCLMAIGLITYPHEN